MILLIPPVLFIDLCAFTFKFHYDSINSSIPFTFTTAEMHLNSIMILLIHRCDQ